MTKNERIRNAKKQRMIQALEAEYFQTVMKEQQKLYRQLQRRIDEVEHLMMEE